MVRAKKDDAGLVDTRMPLARRPLEEWTFQVVGRVVGHEWARIAVDVNGHTVELEVDLGTREGEELLRTIDHCCNGDLVRANVRGLHCAGVGFRRLRLLALDIDFGGISAGLASLGPALWNPADGITRAPATEQSHGHETEAAGAEAGTEQGQAEGQEVP